MSIKITYKLLALAFIYLVFLFVSLLQDVIMSDTLMAADQRIANLLMIFRNAQLTRFFLYITLLGKWQVVLIFVIAALGILWWRRKSVYIAPLLFTIAGSETFVWLLKNIFQRARPTTAVYPEHSFSFPSGHAAIALAFYGFLTYILVRQTKHWAARVTLFLAGIIIILLIGFSRLYLGVHYLSDVWGGYLIGALWLIVGISISTWLYPKKGT